MSVKRAWLVLVLALAGCGSDAGTICSKLIEECHILSTSVSECEEELESAGTDSARSDCAECLDSKSCGTISAGGCAADCAAFASAFPD